MCEPKAETGAGTAVAIGVVVAVVVLVAPAVIAFIDGVMAAALAAVFGAAGLFTAFAVWHLRRELRCEMWRPVKVLPRQSALPLGGQIAIAEAEVRRKAIGSARPVAGIVVSRQDEAVGLRP